jgi:hypothetical protein
MPITLVVLSKVQEVSLIVMYYSVSDMPLGSDNIIQTIIVGGSVFAGAGSYPLEGGYM